MEWEARAPTAAKECSWAGQNFSPGSCKHPWAGGMLEQPKLSELPEQKSLVCVRGKGSWLFPTAVWETTTHTELPRAQGCQWQQIHINDQEWHLAMEWRAGEKWQQVCYLCVCPSAEIISSSKQQSITEWCTSNFCSCVIQKKPATNFSWLSI